MAFGYGTGSTQQQGITVNIIGCDNDTMLCKGIYWKDMKTMAWQRQLSGSSERYHRNTK